MAKDGFIRLPRNILDEPLFQNSNDFRLFIYLLLSANHSETVFKSETLMPGQVAVTGKSLCDATGMTIKQVRRSLENLERANIRADKRANQYSVITIENWELYVSGDGKRADKRANERANEIPVKVKEIKEAEADDGGEKPINKSAFVRDVVQYLNKKANTAYRPASVGTKNHVIARINEGFTLDDFKRVIDFKCDTWLTDPKMVQFLRPETLFGTKFESYLNAAPPPIIKKQPPKYEPPPIPNDGVERKFFSQWVEELEGKSATQMLEDVKRKMRG